MLVAGQSKRVSNFKGEVLPATSPRPFALAFPECLDDSVQGLVLSRLKNTAPGQRVLASEPRKLTVTSAHL